MPERLTSSHGLSSALACRGIVVGAGRGKRWSSVTRTIWTDQRFLSLSGPGPNAQTMWIYLLTCPFQGPVPGLLPVGVGALSDGLGWSSADVAKCIRELSSAGLLEASERPPLIWLKNAVRHNPPDNPNQIKGWRSVFDEMPECALLDKALKSMRESVKPTLHPTFDSVFGERLRKGSVNPLVNQDEDQEQEQESLRQKRKEAKPLPQRLPLRKPEASAPSVDKAESSRQATLLCGELRQAIATHSEEHAKYRVKPNHLKAWAIDIERLIRLDGANPEEISGVIRWAHVLDQGGFWKPNLLSGSALRKHFPRLRLQAEKAGAFRAIGQSTNKELWLSEHSEWLIRSAQFAQINGRGWGPDVLRRLAKADGVPPPSGRVAIELAKWAEARL